MRAAPALPTPAGAAPPLGPDTTRPHRARRRGDLRPSRTPPDCLTSAFRPGGSGIGVGGTGRPLSSVCVRRAVLHRPGRPAECQGSPERPFLKSRASSERVAVCLFDSPAPLSPTPASNPRRRAWRRGAAAPHQMCAQNQRAPAVPCLYHRPRELREGRAGEDGVLYKYRYNFIFEGRMVLFNGGGGWSDRAPEQLRPTLGRAPIQARTGLGHLSNPWGRLLQQPWG